MILDGDLSVLPEDLPKFHRGLVDGRAELVNGSRLVYDMEPGAMRFLNMIGNRVFARLLKGIMGQQVKDTLCGTKVLLKADYERIAAGRSYFGEFDPFGDFDLLFGAAQARHEDRRPAGALPPAHVRRDEHQPLAPRGAAPPDDGLRVLEVQSRAAHTPRRLSGVVAAAVVAAVGRAGARDGGGRRGAGRRRAARPLAVVDVRRRGRELHGGSALNLLLGDDVTFVDHPGLPLTEADGDHVRRRRAPRRGRAVRVDARHAYVDRTLLDLDGTRAASSAASPSLVYLLGRAALVPPLRARLFGHWTWGLAAGLLWAAAPGLSRCRSSCGRTCRSPCCRSCFAYALGRGLQTRAPGSYVAAAALVGVAAMMKLHALGLIAPVLLAAVWRPPDGGWERVVASARRRPDWSRGSALPGSPPRSS